MPAHIPAAVGRGALPLVDKINNRQSVQIGPSYYRPTCSAAWQYTGIRGRTSPLAEKITTNNFKNQLKPESGPQDEIQIQPNPGRRREKGVLPLAEKINGGKTSKLDQVITNILPAYHFEKSMHSTFGLTPVTSR